MMMNIDRIEIEIQKMIQEYSNAYQIALENDDRATVREMFIRIETLLNVKEILKEEKENDF